VPHLPLLRALGGHGPPDEDVKAAPIVKKEAPAFHDETIPLPKRMEMATGGDLKTKLYAAMAQTDCTACVTTARATPRRSRGNEKDPNLCVPERRDGEGRERSLQGTGLPAAKRLTGRKSGTGDWGTGGLGKTDTRIRHSSVLRVQPARRHRLSKPPIFLGPGRDATIRRGSAGKT